jgi:hypothetical protein
MNHLFDVAKRPGFDRYPYLRDSTAAPYVEAPTPRPIGVVVNEFHSRISEMDDHQLAAIYMAVEQEHVNRMAAAAGYVECEEVVF